MKYLKNTLFYSIIQTIIAIIGFSFLCFEVRLNKINNERIENKLKTYYIMNYIYNVIDDINDMIKIQDYCENNPEKVSERYATIVINFKSIYQLLFNDEILLQEIYYGDKQFRDFIDYFIISSYSYVEKNLFDKKYKCYCFNENYKDTILEVYFSKNELQKIHNIIKDLQKNITLETS